MLEVDEAAVQSRELNYYFEHFLFGVGLLAAARLRRKALAWSGRFGTSTSAHGCGGPKARSRNTFLPAVE